MRPAFLENLSWEMAEVYGAVQDRILINLAKYFPYAKEGTKINGSFAYQAKMLAQMGQVNRETIQIIRDGLQGADETLKNSIAATILEALHSEDPKLEQAAIQGLLPSASGALPPVTANMSQAFQAYYRQSADKLNLVNTVMLESTQQAYAATVADVASRLSGIQRGLNVATGEAVSGVSTYNQAIRHAVDNMVVNGITGFVDHAGRRWHAETYAAMDIKTTLFNTARAAVWERQEQYGNDLYQVSSHIGARPLCYPYQGKVISRTDSARVVTDLDGNEIHVIPQSQTSYGQAAGLFGINCKHYPMTFIPGFSTLKGEHNRQDEEENTETYENLQHQRGLERKIREQKRDLEILKAQGAPDETIKAARNKVKRTSLDIDDFCAETGLPRRRNREGTPINSTWPNPLTYDASTFTTAERDRINAFFGGGGSQNPTGTPTGITQPPQNVAKQATQTVAPVVQSPADTFVPAKTRAEAEEYARQHFASVVTYNGSITVDTMNTVNRTLKELTDAYPIARLRSIQQNGRMNALARANGGSLDVNGKKIDVETGDDYAQRQAYARKRLQALQTAYPQGIPRYHEKAVREYEEILKYSRWTIDDQMEPAEKVRATIAHEYGHILADQHCGQLNRGYYCKDYFGAEATAKRKLIEDTFARAKATGDIYLLSEYGGSNSHEFFAETFSAMWANDTSIPEYFYDMIRGVV